MASLSSSTLVQLTGFDTNVVVSDMIFGETWQTDVIFTSDSGRVVSNIASNVITFIGGDNSVFAIGAFVTFVDDTTAYQITAIGTNTLTLSANPSTKANGDPINVSINFDAASTLMLRVSEYASTGVTDKKGVLDLGTVTQKTPAIALNFDTSTVWVDVSKGWARISLLATAFSDTPTPADAPEGRTPVIYAGYLGVNRPGSGTVLDPAITDKQRLVWLIWSALA